MKMKKNQTLQVEQLEKFARFLEEHPSFSPMLIGEDADVYGFQVGECFLMIQEMEKLIATQAHFNPREAERLLAPSGVFRRPEKL
jgi:hypothetical protein